VGTVEAVQNIYAAFGRGDIEAVLDQLADDVEWDTDLPPDGPPWLRPRRGKQEAGEFFAELPKVLEFTRFEPYAVFGDERHVVALIAIEATVPANGNKFADQRHAHVWQFDDQGRVKLFRHLADTRKHFEAWSGS
jgi:uncharacterized protein